MEGACIKIRASLPPPQPSPASGGGSAPSPRRCRRTTRRWRTAFHLTMSNSPSQRFAGPLNLARGRRVSLFPFSPNGERSAEKAPTCRACEARLNHAVGGVGRPFAIRDARLSALHRGDFGPGAALPSPALPPENAFSELLAAQVIVPGGRGPEPPGARGYEPPPQDATPRSASRTVSRNARHPSGDGNFII
jgi:hypothetical protein